MQFIDLKAQYQKIEDKIKSRIHKVLEHGQFIMGPEIAELEDKLANFVGVKHCISCSSGSDALFMALLALDLKPGDEVIIPDFTFFATAEVVSLLGATPVFVDVREDTCNIDEKLIEAAITNKTRAIMSVSLYGQCAEMDEINAIAKKHGLFVIEDACQSFGGEYKGRKSCSLSDIGCTSFFPSKPLGCYGDGGALFTNDDEIADKLRSYRIHGQVGRYNHPNIGINGRLDTIQAAILLEKFEIFPDEIEARQRVAKEYSEKLGDNYKMTRVLGHNKCAWAQFTIHVDNRDEFCAQLKEKGIPTAIHYPKPVSVQPYYVEQGIKADCPVSAMLARRVVSLPFHPQLSTQDICNVSDALLK